MKIFFIMLVCCLSLCGNGCLQANPANVASIFSGCSDNTQSHQCHPDSFTVNYGRLNLKAYGYARFDTLQRVLVIQDEMSHTEKKCQALLVQLGAKDEKIDWNKKVYIYTQVVYFKPDKYTEGVFVSHLSTSELPKPDTLFPTFMFAILVILAGVVMCGLNGLHD